VLVQAYSFTSAPIAKAVVDAKKRALDVRVILDKSNVRQGYSAATFLEHAGIPVLIDSAHGIAHNKVMILDGQTVITGSFNFTKAAEEHNAENLVVIHDGLIAALYAQNWKAHAAHSRSLTGLGESFRRPRGVQNAKGEDKGSTTFVGNRRSYIYAWPSCASYDTMAPQNRVVFLSAQAAEAAGYRKAGNCP